MSFHFIELERKATKPAKGRTAAPINQHNAATLHRLGCAACPLKDCGAHTPYMKPTLGGGSVYFLAEAPGRDEDEHTGRPLTGASGSLLRECLPDGGDSWNFDNVVNCRPPNNRTPTPKEIECCRPRRIKYIEQAKPTLIVGLGATPMHAIIGSGDLAGLRG